MSKYLKLFLFVIVPLAIVAGLIAWKIPITRGLDIAGGIRVVLQADPQRGDDWPKTSDKRLEKMRSIRKTITERVKGIQGTGEPVVQVQDDDKIIVELPGVENTEDALDRIRSTASLEFYYLRNVRSEKNPTADWDMSPIPDAEGGQKGYEFRGPRGESLNSIEDKEAVLEKVVGAPKVKPVLTGQYLIPKVNTGINPPNEVVIHIEFDKQGREIFRDFTRNHVGEILAIFFDGRLLTAPVVKSVIPDGKAEISGFSSLPEARMTADYLEAGALPVPLKVIAKDTVEPTLGKETVSKVLFAGIVGILLVVLFMTLYYRLPGFIASVAVILYALFTISFFKAIHATMSLAGIAALIISVGMAVDANVLIFERLKEELRSGKTLKAAIDAGFNRAFSAIFDSNMCSVITCAILLWFGTPSVQSFAFTLMFGVIISMFTAITVTRTILHLLVGWEWAQNPNLYGLGTSLLLRITQNWDFVGKRAYYFVISAILIVPGLVFLMMFGFKYGIEFRSGTTVQASFKNPVTTSRVLTVADSVIEGSQVQLADRGKTAFIKTTLLSEDPNFNEKLEELRSAIDSQIGLATVSAETKAPAFDSVNSVGPAISEEMTKNAIIAIAIASVLIVVYIAFRFAIGGLGAGLKYGVCAVSALVHDVAFILGLFAILGKLLGWEVDSLFVTAILTVIGFSVHDTIVVFDRIRENLKHRQRGENFEQLANRSIVQTMVRSINTGFAVVLTLGALIVFGGPLLRPFYVALLVGIAIGTYSSIFNATQLVVVWDNVASRTKEPRKKTFEDKPMVSKPMVTGPDPSAGSGNGREDVESQDVADAENKSAARSSAKIKRKKKRF